VCGPFDRADSISVRIPSSFDLLLRIAAHNCGTSLAPRPGTLHGSPDIIVSKELAMRRGWWLAAATAFLLGAFLTSALAQDPMDGKKKKKTIPPPVKVEEPTNEEIKKGDPKLLPFPPGAFPPGTFTPGIPALPTNPSVKIDPKAKPQPHPYSQLEGRTIVFVVNDAGSRTDLSDGLPEAMEGAGCVVTKNVNWTRTAFETRKDWHDHQAMGRGAGRIAMDVGILRKEAPHCRIVIIGHGVGCHVALMAAEMCPAKSIDRIILLAPSVSRRYCLDVALAASKGGIDNFYSSLDFTLDHWASHSGTSDGDQSGTTAGQYGFSVQRGAKGCENLRQIAWGDRMTHHNGGHYGWTRPRVLADWVVPLINCDAPPAPPVPRVIVVPPPAPPVKDGSTK
jgi:hypothetical protein